MKAITDTSSLIHPAKVPSFWRAMMDTFEEILIPEAVHQEILKGKELPGSTDVPVIESAINNGWVKVLKVRTSLKKLPDPLGAGERDAIALMREMKVNWLLMDDEIATLTAKSMGLETRPISYLPIYWTNKRVFKPSESLLLLDDLVSAGYRLSTKDYVLIKEIILKISR